MNKKEEIFTIGDKTTLGIITNFRLLDDEMMVDFDSKNSILLKSKQLQHSKKPLFTTEDGVDIFEDDEVVCFDKEDWITRNEKYKFQPFDVKDKNYLFFSTKEKAEKYILMNKKSLSPNDILKVWSGISGYSISSLTENSRLLAEILKHLKDENNKK